MKNNRHEIALWVQAGVFIGLWLLLVYISDDKPAVSMAALSKIPDVVFFYSVLYLVFTKWLWRWRIFRGWLIPFPDLEGTWEGHIQSTWVDPATDQTPEPIRVILVIKQTFSTLSCTMHTRESSSVSTAASFHMDESNDSKSVAYVFTNTPRVSVRDWSAVHQGAAMFRVVSAPELRLEGEYWTNRKSTGEMRLTRSSTKLVDGFYE
jgi:hypothetical protein